MGHAASHLLWHTYKGQQAVSSNLVTWVHVKTIDLFSCVNGNFTILVYQQSQYYFWQQQAAILKTLLEIYAVSAANGRQKISLKWRSSFF